MSTATEGAAARLAVSPSTRRRATRRFLSQPLSVCGLAFLIVLILAAVFAPFVAPHDAEEIFWDSVRSPPSAQFWFGTDEIGRDILSRLIFGARVSLEIVFGAIAVALVYGAAIGLFVGHVGGWVDDIAMRIIDGMQAFPSLILALAVVAVLGPNVADAMIAIALTNIPEFGRLVRDQVLLIREQGYVQAARAIGRATCASWPIIFGRARSAA